MFIVHCLDRHVGVPRWRDPCAMVMSALATLGMGCSPSQATGSRDAQTPAASRNSAEVAGDADGDPPVDVPSTGQTTGDRARRMDTERALAEEATLPGILRLALAQNPELAEAGARARAARELAPAASRLPDPELEYQLWAQPLARPYALDQAEMHMVGLRQSFPAPGRLGAQSEAASARAAVALQASRAREQDLVARVRRAYAEYYRSDREYRIHLNHVRLAQQTLDVARAAYQGTRGSQQDVLRAAVELSRLHNDVATIDRDRRTAAALLNTLMARDPNAPLGPPAALDPSTMRIRIDQLERILPERRPEIAAAKSAIRVREKELAAASSSARWPSFMVGLQYMYMPLEAEPHNYGVMFSMSLPWLNPRYGEELRAAEATLAAERSALSSTRLAARYELYEAVQRLKAARESFQIIERDLLPQAQQSFESAEAAYRGGQGDSLGMLDALRSLLDVRLERERALALVDSALADTERAAGGPIASATHTEGE
jgi:cobalt-zinc-cadmium efflux system outer membrane protein